MDKMTLFYKKSDNRIISSCTGVQGIKNMGGGSLTEEELSLIYGLIVIDYNEYILAHYDEFELIFEEDGSYSLKLIASALENIKKYI